VVALLENEFATLKRFFKEASRIRLEPANAKMEPIFATNVKIQGIVRGVIRRYG
jgi:repressor LexA